LHKKYAPTPEAFERVFTHSQIVNDVAQALLKNSSSTLDKELLHVGCLLHDIGVYKVYDTQGNISDDYIKHGILGDTLLQSENFPEEIRRFASHHTGVGLTKTDIEQQHLPLPHQDYVAETEIEFLIMYADKFHSKSEPPHFNTAEYYKKYVSRFGDDKVKKFENMIVRFGVPDVYELSNKYGHVVRN